MNFPSLLTAFLLTTVCSLPVSSQITANFNLADTLECSDIEIVFNNTTVTSEALSYFWDFGNGLTSTDSIGKATFSAGSYTVKLVASNGITADSTTLNLTINQSPTANFNTPDTLGCIDYNVTFESSSTAGDASISKFYWDFNDGDNSSLNPITHTYTSGGFKDPSLTVTDANGCYHTIKKNNLIQVVNRPSVNFSTVPDASCSIPDDVEFRPNASTSYGTLSYAWNFDDGATSTGDTVSHTYTNYDTYQVTLTVTNNELGCVNVKNKNYYVLNVQSNGEIHQGADLKANEAFFCRGTLDFKSTSSGNNRVAWDFDNGSTSTSTNTSSTYAASGPYDIMLIADYSGFCPDTTLWTLHADSITANFNLSPTSSCETPTMVDYTDASLKAVSWLYTFDDATTSASANPSHENSLDAEPDPYYINVAVPFLTSLKVTSVNGCTDQITKSMNITKPTAALSADTIEGCAPLNVTFFDKSPSTADSLFWIFGDGNFDKGISAQVDHEYSAEGTYNAQLVIKNSNGCPDTSYVVTIRVGREITPNFTISTNAACNGESISLTNTSSELGLIDYAYFDIDGDKINFSPDSLNAEFINKLDTGYHDISLHTYYRGCKSSVTKADTFQSNGGYAYFDIAHTCASPMTYDFPATSTAFTAINWSFGDGNTNTGTFNGSNVYTTDGNYNVRLIVENGACVDTMIRTIPVRDTIGQLIAPDKACAGSTVEFNGAASYTINENCKNNYLWYPGDTQQPKRYDTTSHVSYTYTERGEYEVKLITNYDNGCIDSAKHTITVFEPYAGFTMDADTGCSPFLVTFTDTSKPDFRPLNVWKWYFDTNDSITYSVATHDTFPEHTYIPEGVNTIRLKVTDDFGCFNEVSHSVRTYNPNASFTLAETFACVNTNLNFSYSYNADSAQWLLGNEDSITDYSKNITYAYSTGGTYTPGLILYKYTCSDTVFKIADYLTIEQPYADFTPSKKTTYCYPEELSFSLNNTLQPIQSLLWDMGVDTITFVNDNDTMVTNTYYLPGFYPVSLLLTSDNNCSVTFADTIEIRGPIGSFNVSPMMACKEDSVLFELNDTNYVTDIAWAFPYDDTSHVAIFKHRFSYYAEGPQLILSGDSGCIKTYDIPIEFYNINAYFDVKDTTQCSTIQYPFINQSGGYTSSSWDFGNGTTSIEENPTASYEPGVYDITLVVTNDSGCVDTAFNQLNFVRLQDYTILNKKDFMCEGTSFTTGLSGGDSVIWYANGSELSTNEFAPTFTPDVTTEYVALIFDKQTGCSNYDTMLINIQRNFDINVDVHEPESLIIGEGTTIQADSLSDVIYLWSPDSAISCLNCAEIKVNPLTSTLYTLTVKDTNDCFIKNIPVNITVEEKYNLAMPSAIVPTDTDYGNNLVYVKGWGIKELLEFSVYSRQGTQVFYTNDLNTPWDGTYENKTLDVGTYVYVVTVKTYNDEEITKKGTITLIK